MAIFNQPNTMRKYGIVALLKFIVPTIVVVLATSGVGFTQNLEQGRNGGANNPVTPVPFGNGNSGTSNSHYLEGMSSPYRLVLDNLSPGSHSFEMEYDIRKSGLNAMDYITSFQRLEPHTQFGHPTEFVNPLIGLTGYSNVPVTYPIPTPIVNKVVTCTGLIQPSTDFNLLPQVERMMTMYNGVSIDTIYYVPLWGSFYGDLNASASSAIIRVEYTTVNADVVFAFGGHLAQASAWCPGLSASGISGSSYHMRINAVDGSAGGQDMSLSASAVIPIPPCDINGDDRVCANSTVTYTKDPFIGYSYTWALTNNTSGASIIGSNVGSTIDVNSGNSSGSYTIELTMSGPDYTGTCTKNVQVDLITVSSTIIDYSCITSQGEVDITVLGASAPYTFAWSNGATTEDLSTIAAGSYTVTVTGVQGCTASLNAIVNSNSSIVLSLPKTDVLCFGDADGTINSNTSGGISPYSYLWSNGATTQNISGLTVGTYTLTVTDSTGCIETVSNTLIEPTVLAVSPQSIANVSCNGSSNGNIILTVTGGTQPYSYLWSEGSTNQDLGNVTAGTYTVTVTDDNGCTRLMSQVITEPDLLTDTLQNIQNISCFGLSDGSITMNTYGGVAPYSYIWSNGSTAQNLSGVPAGTYTVTITDANGCTESDSQTLTQPALSLSSVATVTGDVLCFGGNDGSANVVANGGTAPYTYLWSNSAVTQALTGVSVGTYTVTVTDANGCTQTTSTIINEPSAPLNIGSAIGSDALCFGTPNGSIVITVSGGTTPYSYSWSNGQTTQDVLGIPSGTYTVTVTDGNGCNTSTPISISQPAAAINASTTVTGTVSCFSGNNGAIDLTVTGGTTPYSYLWSTGANTEDVSGLSAGTYTVTVTDVNGCTYSISEVISQPVGALSTNINISPPVSCFGGSNGIVDITVSGGTAPYNYVWSTGATTQDITGMPAGVYTITITDQNGCNAILSTTITQPPTPLLGTAITAQDVLCTNGNTGSVDLTVTGGTPPYTYVWNNGFVSEDLSNMQAGTYNVTITDVNGCVTNASATINEPAASLFSAAILNQAVSCNGGGDGSINLIVSGGTVPYSYSWSNGITTQNISGLAANLYTVTVTDANGCISTDTLTITQPVAPVSIASTTVQNVNCFGDNTGSINLNVTGGTSPYSYLWSNGSTTQNINSITSGTYTVTVTDANGCITSSTSLISQPALPLSSTAFADPNVYCYGDSTGSANLTISGGTGPYTFLWNTGATTEDIFNIPAGSYTVVITDANGCTDNQTVSVNQPSLPLGTAVPSAVNVLCFGDLTGSIDLLMSGGTPPYSFNWSNGQTTEDLNTLPAGAYSVVVTDSNGCVTNASIAITQPAATLDASVSATINVSCFGGSTGSINTTITGGTTPYTFNWSNGSTAQNISSISDGVYTVTVTDANGCTFETSTTISQPVSVLVVAATLTQDVLCYGDNSGGVFINAVGGTSPFTFNWSNGATTHDISAVNSGTYTVTVTDANGCTAEISSTVNEPTAALSAISAVTSNISCFSGNNGSIDVTVNGGTAPYTYLWNTGVITEDITGLAAGIYTVTVTDVNSCVFTVVDTIVQPPGALSVALTTAQNVFCYGGNNGAVNISTSGGTGPYTYQWSTGDSISNLAGLTAGIYTVTVTDINGCNSNQSINITEPVIALNANPFDIQDVLCKNDSTGYLDIFVIGGTLPYSFSWSNGATTEDIFNLTAGIYTVTITDTLGCTLTLTDTITEPALSLSAGNTAVPVNCFGGNDGSINLTVNGGVSPYTFEWNNGALTQNISNLSAGTYSVTVTDTNGCVINSSFSLTEPTAPLSDSLVNIQHVLCNGGQTGTIDVFVTGGTAPYSYLWSNGDTTQLADSLGAGVYTLTVTDVNGCSLVLSDTIIGYSAITSTISMNPVLCNLGADGSLSITTQGGTAPFSFSWSNGDSTSTISNLVAGSYSVTITDVNGCTSVNSMSVTQPSNPISLSGSTYNANCLAGSGGGVNLTTTGGTPLYSYIWSNGDSTQNLTGVMGGSYSVVVTDMNGCTDSLTFVIGNYSSLVLAASAIDFCVGETTTLTADSIPGAQYQWYYNGTILAGATNDNFTTPAGGYYYVVVTTSCGVFTSDTLQVVAHTIDNISVSNPQFICPPENTSLLATGGVSYSWSPATNINFTNISNPTVYPTETTLYSVVITNEYGCTTQLSVPVSVICDSLLVPTGFSPNDDGVNDGYVIDDIQSYPGNKLWIYNRWGNLVYKAKDYANTWNGVSNVKGMYFGTKVPSGTYFYILDLNDGSNPRSGYLIIKL
jgi:gliding motility-associated-like protein